jgi:hypothetical protein
VGGKEGDARSMARYLMVEVLIDLYMCMVMVLNTLLYTATKKEWSDSGK